MSPRTSDKFQTFTENLPELGIQQEEARLSSVQKQERSNQCYYKLLDEASSKCNLECLARKFEEYGDDESAQILRDEIHVPEKQKKPKSRLGKFIYALSFLGFHPILTPMNHDKGEKLLQEIIAEDPSNSYPIYFMALYKFQLGLNYEGKLLLQEAMSLEEFNPYYQDFYQRSLMISLQDPVLHVQMTTIWSMFPIPSHAVFKQLLDYDLEAAADIAQKLTAPYEENEGKFENFKWDRFDFSVGTIMQKKILNPRKKRVYIETEDYKYESISDEYQDIFSEELCELQTLEKRLKKYSQFITDNT